MNYGTKKNRTFQGRTKTKKNKRKSVFEDRHRKNNHCSVVKFSHRNRKIKHAVLSGTFKGWGKCPNSSITENNQISRHR